MRTYEKEKAVKSADNFSLHSTDKQKQSIIDWRVRTYEKKAIKSAEKFFAQPRNNLNQL